MPMSNERVEGQLRDLFGGEPPDLEPSLPIRVMPLHGEVRPRCGSAALIALFPKRNTSPSFPGDTPITKESMAS
jgi:hypothetical protein